MIYDILMYAVLINIPSYVAIMFPYAYMFDFKECLNPVKLAKFVTLISIIDAITKYTIDPSYQDLIKLPAGAICLSVVYGFSPITSFLSYFMTYIGWAIVNIVSILALSPFGISPEQFSTSIKYGVLAEVIYIPILLLMALIISKRNFSWKWFAKREFLSKLKLDKYWHEHERYLVPFVFVLFIILFSSTVFMLRYITYNQAPSVPFYFVFSCLTCIAFSYPYFKLIKEHDSLNTRLKNSEQLSNMLKENLDKYRDVIKASEKQNEVS